MRTLFARVRNEGTLTTATASAAGALTSTALAAGVGTILSVLGFLRCAGAFTGRLPKNTGRQSDLGFTGLGL